MRFIALRGINVFAIRFDTFLRILSTPNRDVVVRCNMVNSFDSCLKFHFLLRVNKSGSCEPWVISFVTPSTKRRVVKVFWSKIREKQSQRRPKGKRRDKEQVRDEQRCIQRKRLRIAERDLSDLSDLSVR